MQLHSCSFSSVFDFLLKCAFQPCHGSSKIETHATVSTKQAVCAVANASSPTLAIFAGSFQEFSRKFWKEWANKKTKCWLRNGHSKGGDGCFVESKWMALRWGACFEQDFPSLEDASNWCASCGPLVENLQNQNVTSNCSWEVALQIKSWTVIVFTWGLCPGVTMSSCKQYENNVLIRGNRSSDKLLPEPPWQEKQVNSMSCLSVYTYDYLPSYGGTTSLEWTKVCTWYACTVAATIIAECC